jgi:transposase-like protein
MFRTPGLVHIILTLVLLATCLLQPPAEWHSDVWDARLVLASRCRQRRNPRRNLERRLRRRARGHEPRRLRRRQRRRSRERIATSACWLSPASLGVRRGQEVPSAQAVSPAGPKVSAAEPPDPLADLRQQRGWIDRVSQPELWHLLIRIRWPNGERCPHCGEDDRQYLHVIDANYRGGLGRWRCDVCAEAGDPGEGGTFTPLTGTLLEGMRMDIASLWLVVEHFVAGQAAVETADEARLHRHTTQRLFRLLRAALYQNRSSQPIALAPAHIVEGDEVYITAGVKGQAGGLALERAPRKRGLKRRGRGTWESDRLPVFGLLRRDGQVRLFVLRNVQSATIRPIVHQMVGRGATVYTDSYSIYHFLARDGYQHRTVNHGAGEYARDEVHCNTMECTWSWLRQMIRTYRGVSKIYLPLYVAQFEFFYNRRHASRWSCMLDLMHIALQVEAAPLLARVDSAEFAEVCPVAG